MKNTKKIAFLCIAINIILLLQLCFGTVMALEEEASYIEPEQTVEEAVSEQVEEAVIEAQDGEMQIMAAGGNYTHYYNLETWSNGNCKSITYAQYNSCGKIIDGPWTMTYPSTGDGAFAFNGCKCANCK